MKAETVNPITCYLGLSLNFRMLVPNLKDPSKFNEKLKVLIKTFYIFEGVGMI